VISVNADMTGLIGVGYRIRLTQTTAKYFIVTAVGAYSGGATLITVYGGTDYTLADEAITSPYYSYAKAPLGFPMNPAKWTVTVESTTSTKTTTPTQGVWYNHSSIDVPIGSWKLGYNGTPYLLDAGGGGIFSIYITLSTSNNSESDKRLTGIGYAVNPGHYHQITRDIFLTLASKATYYLNIKTGGSGVDTIGMYNANCTLIIQAVCAYL
jgi:hypothetical protein